MSQKLHFAIINALTSSSPFSGNPTPVFILDHLPSWLPAKTMQLIAREVNHSDTTFLRSCHAQVGTKNKNIYEIRWFTPREEEPFCGHGVLASALALYSLNRGTEFVFKTLNNGREVSAAVKNDESSSLTMGGVNREVEVQMTFPSLPADQEVQNANEVRERFLRVLGLQDGDIVGLKRNGLGDVVDFEKRVFAYGCEDQATGSTYCLLAPYWERKLGKKRMRAVQTSARRGEADLEWDEEKAVVIIKGRGVKTVEGDVLLPSQGILARL